jgi:ATP-binding cassette subfamily B protein
MDSAWHDRSKIGDHMSRATNDTESVRMFFGIGLLLILDSLFYFILVPIYMVTISWKLTLASIVTVPLIPIIVAKLTHVVERRWDEVQAQFASVSERARESFAGVRVVKTFAREDTEVRSFAKQVRDYFGKSMRFAKVFTLEMPLLVLMLGLADLVVVAYGGHLVLTGELRIGGFAAFSQYLIRLAGPMIGLGWTIMLYQRGKVSMSRIEEITDLVPGIVDPDGPPPERPIRGGIEFRGLTFAYGDAPVLADIDFTLAPGRTLGVMGPVGSGKTTLLNLIPRLYDPPPGTVLVDGEDIRDLPLTVLRGAIGVVPQEAFLFSESIRENVAGGANRKKVREGLVEACTRTARVDDDIRELNDGYDTLLGERGVNLSGGQKQRVAIARALAREPAILLFDDCLSAVDTETEKGILSGLAEASRHITTVIASHRVSAVKEADEIIVLSGGRIVERGTHGELIERSGYYAELDRKQSEDGE